MTPEQDSPEEDVVRGLLAAAGAEPEPMPAAVAARLDAALAALSPADVERVDPGEPAPAADLRERRRSRRWPQALVAAAAVGVIAAGAATVLGDGLNAGGGEASTASDTAAGAAAPEAVVPESAGGDAKAAPPTPLTGGPAAAPLALRTGSFAADVQRYVDFRLDEAPGRRADALPPGCAVPVTGSGDRVVPASLDSAPAVLVLRAPYDGRQRAEAFTCHDATSPAVSATVEVR